MIEVELNNGEKVQIKRIRTINGPGRKENHEEMLLRIMDEATDKLGHVPTFEEAKKCPWMPKRPDLYDIYCNSYDTAVRKVKKLRSTRERNRKAWRKMTPEEIAEAERLEEIKRRRTGISEIFSKPPTWLMGRNQSTEQDMKELKKRREILKGSKTEKGDDSMSKNNWTKEKIVALMKDYYDKYSRIPTCKEIQKMDNWPKSASTVSRFLGPKAKWYEAIGAPDPEQEETLKIAHQVAKTQDAVEAPTAKMVAERFNPSQKAKDSTKKLKKKPKPLEKARVPREVFFSSIEERLKIIDSSGGGRVDLLMTVQLLGEDEPTDLVFSIDTLK